MLISKFDLYNPEWLELVFRDRNKEYGAYYLRQHYAGNMVRAMSIAFFGVAVLFGANAIFSSHPEQFIMTDVPIAPKIVQPPVVDIKDVKRPTPTKPARIEPPAPPVAAQQYVPFVPTTAPVNTDPTPPTGPIGSTTTQGTPGGENVLPTTSAPSGTGVETPPDNTIHSQFALDVMPEPIGGNAAWSKFLRKNLRFPNEAQDLGVGGRVILSFVIEKDGKLSNIVVDRAAGHGFDEEALRVLKLAKAWKPGMQNGQPVRVKYEIPINFQAIEQ